ncbi:MAG: FecR family protein [Verrucomicrobiota bacterium]
MSELDNLINGYLSQSLDSDQTARLNNHLAESREARDEFRARVRIHADLADHFSEAADLRFEPIGERLTAPSLPFSPWFATAAALVIVSITAMVTSPWRTSPPIAQGVARMVASIDADWKGKAPDEDETLPAGAHELLRGSIDLLFADGARISMRGPARFDLRSSRHIHLESGNLVARIPDEALGFIVTSPQSEIVDLGTEFGLSVTDEGQTDVHVIDGLVEVLSNGPDTVLPGILIREGQARRFTPNPNSGPSAIPIRSREALLGRLRYHDLGVQMLHGSVRIASGLRAEDLFTRSQGRSWIQLIPEQRGVTLTKPLEVTLDAPGSYRDFRDIRKTLPAGTRVDSYLLHFRPRSTGKVRGVIRFDQPIVAVICNGLHLLRSDKLFGVPSVHYPTKIDPRGMEPGPFPDSDALVPEFIPDEIILSQDRSAVSIYTAASLEGGFYDQVRVLTLAPDQP